MSLFINKTPNSKTFSHSRDEPETCRGIHQHAQVFRLKARGQRPKALTSPSSAPVGWLHRPLDQTSLDSGGSTSGGSQLSMRRKATSSAYCSHGYRTMGACPRCSRSSVLVLYNAPSKNTANPFAILPTAMDTEKYSIMQYFLRPDLPVQVMFYHLDAVARKDMAQACLSDDLHFYSLLASVTARMKFVTKDLFTRQDLPEYLAFRATSLMRQYLLNSKPVTEQIIIDIFLLATAEQYNQDWSAVLIHRTAIKHCVAGFGGILMLDPSIRVMLWRLDLFVATVTCTQPVLELCWDPGPLESQAEISATIISAGGLPPMGASFRENFGTTSNHALLDTIEDVVYVTDTMQYFWTGFTAVPWDRKWIWARGGALVHRLLSLEPIAFSCSSSPGSTAHELELDILVEECTRSAIVIWLHLGFFLLGRSPVQHKTPRVVVRFFSLSSVLQQRLIRMMKLTGFLEMNVPTELSRHWMLVLWNVGMSVLAAVKKEEMVWLSRHFITISARVGITTYEDFEAKISSRYLWLRPFEEASGRPLTKLYKNVRLQNEHKVVVAE